MKKVMLFLFAASMLVACSEKLVKVEVANETSIEQENETVTVAWSDLAQNLSLQKGKTIIVLGEDGVQIPYQILYNGQDTPQEVIFQTSLGKGEKITYIIKEGKPETFQQLTFGDRKSTRLNSSH